MSVAGVLARLRPSIGACNDKGAPGMRDGWAFQMSAHAMTKRTAHKLLCCLQGMVQRYEAHGK